MLIGNTVIRKFKTKLTARIALRLLPAKTQATRLKGRFMYIEALILRLTINIGKVLRSAGASSSSDESSPEDDIEVPEEVENVLEELFRCLQDKVSAVPGQTLRDAQFSIIPGYHCSMVSRESCCPDLGASPGRLLRPGPRHNHRTILNTLHCRSQLVRPPSYC